MDSLKALVAEKRKVIQDDSTRPTKYMRRGDIDRMKEEQEGEEKRLAEEARKLEEEAAQAAKKVSFAS
jgi:pre-mRNA-splicing factor 18